MQAITSTVKPRATVSREAGFNLIEAAIVLGIVGLIVGGIWAAASSAYENMRQQAASKNLLSFAQAIRGYYANSGAATISTTMSDAITQGLVPADMRQGTTAAASPWATPVTLGTGAIVGVNTFGILFSGLEQSTCINLINRNTNSAGGAGLIAVAGTATMPTTLSSFPLPATGAGSSTALCATVTGNAPSFWFTIN
jgi:Tfp pilus assembly protein PilE